jgi:hypothetical protein
MCEIDAADGLFDVIAMRLELIPEIALVEVDNYIIIIETH